MITSFYQAFKSMEVDRMLAHYHPQVIFEDPAFGELNYEEVCAMWHMLIESQRGQDFQISYRITSEDEQEGKANWEAHYTFSRTGRRVHNVIEAHMRFEQGQIIQHHDNFNLHRWAGQALGWSGRLIGWTPYFRKQLQAQTNRMLKRYMQR